MLRSPRSCPAQNPLPAPVSSTARIAGSRFHAVEGALQRRVHRLVEAVELVGAVEGHRQDRAVQRHQKGLVHPRCSLSSTSASIIRPTGRKNNLTCRRRAPIRFVSRLAHASLRQAAPHPEVQGGPERARAADHRRGRGQRHHGCRHRPGRGRGRPSGPAPRCPRRCRRTGDRRHRRGAGQARRPGQAAGRRARGAARPAVGCRHAPGPRRRRSRRRGHRRGSGGQARLFGDLEAVVAPDAILATNTSSLSVTAIACCACGGRTASSACTSSTRRRSCRWSKWSAALSPRRDVADAVFATPPGWGKTPVHCARRRASSSTGWPGRSMARRCGSWRRAAATSPRWTPSCARPAAFAWARSSSWT